VNPYRVELSSHAQRQFKKLPLDLATRLKAGILALANDPRPKGVVKLTGEENAWRIRVGEYRVIYEIRDEILLILVVEIAHRREVYRR
jgi:mRNA interferase RelE/StbE